MAKSRDILGMNARTLGFIRPENKRPHIFRVDNKIATKKLLDKAHLPTPKIYHIFETAKDVNNFDFNKLPASFVIKPTRGFGGAGILVVYGKRKDAWVDNEGEEVTIDQMRLHILDILDGSYSLFNIPDTAFIEQKIKVHRAFRRLTYRGTPDIRVIVYNKVPIMAMMRLPTSESSGRANLHQGAIGIGIDIASGITVHATYKGKSIKVLPGKKTKLHGLRIPYWDEILHLASEAQFISRLGYLGVDIVLERDEGPMILELNARPGLQIQNANCAPLYKRLRRVEDMDVKTPEKGVSIAKELFAEDIARKVETYDEKPVVGILEPVKIIYKGGEEKIIAKIDTGAKSTSICKSIIDHLGLKKHIIDRKIVRSALGREEREMIHLKFYLKGKKIDTDAYIADRRHLLRDMIIGRDDLKKFIVDPTKNTKLKYGERNW